MSLQSKMPRVVQDYLVARIIPTEGFRPGREKEGVVLSPYRQRGRPMRAEEFLKLGVECGVAFVVTDDEEKRGMRDVPWIESTNLDLFHSAIRIPRSAFHDADSLYSSWRRHHT